MRVLTSVVVALTLAACGGKKAPETPEPAEAPKAEITAEIPEGPDAKKFTRALADSGLQDLAPSGSSDFSMSLQFALDGTYTGEGVAELGGETLECTETGTWSIDSMDGEQASMNWTITKTNCPNRTNGDTQRVAVQLGNPPKVSFR